jgi:hypothetical protein
MALNAEVESMCTSSITYTLKRPRVGAYCAVSRSWRISSTLVFVAASTAAVDLGARGALPAGLRGQAGFAVEALCEDARERGLSDPARSREQVGVMQALLLERVPERAHDVLLPDQAAEVPRPPLSRKYLIAHA